MHHRPIHPRNKTLIVRIEEHPEYPGYVVVYDERRNRGVMTLAGFAATCELAEDAELPAAWAWDA